MRLNTNVMSIDPRFSEVALADGNKVSYDRLLLATGAEPVRLPIQVPTSRTYARCARLRTVAPLSNEPEQRAGQSYWVQDLLGLRSRPRCVHATSRSMWWRAGKIPMERILGPQMGGFVRALHEEHAG